MKIVAAVAALTAAGAFALGYGAANLDRDQGSSAERTAYSFNYALIRNNTGRACSWVSDEFRAWNCPAKTDWRIVERVDNPDGTVRFKVASPSSPGQVYWITVVQHANGKWRIDRIV